LPPKREQFQTHERSKKKGPMAHRPAAKANKLQGGKNMGYRSPKNTTRDKRQKEKIKKGPRLKTRAGVGETPLSNSKKRHKKTSLERKGKRGESKK